MPTVETSPQPTPTPTPTPQATQASPTPSPTPAPSKPNTTPQPPPLTLDSQSSAPSGTLSTNKSDYSPNETVVIKADNLAPNTAYTIIIHSDDPPPVTKQDAVTSNAEGKITYVYQLDGITRLTYTVTLLSTSGAVVATTSFTDPASKPDLTISKSNDTSDSVTKGNSFNWTLTISNGGSAKADFSNNATIATDDLPTSGATYGTVTVSTAGGVTGTTSCSISTNTLTCTGGSGGNKASIPASGSITVTIPVTTTATGTLTNPRSGGSCSVDPNGDVSESNENNNSCSSNSVTVNADTTAPSAPGTPSTTTPTTNTKPTWTWTAATDNVGIDHYIFYWGTSAGSETNNSGSLSSSTLSFTHSIALADGTWYGKAKAFDAAGNNTASGNGSVLVDTTAPTTTDNIDGNWHNSDVTVTLTCTDNVGGSGCAATYHTTDGSTPTTSSSTTNPFTITTEGTYTVKYFSKDTVGNTESVKTAANQVKIDKTAPTTPTASPPAGDYSSDQSVTLSSSDASSGVASIYTPLTQVCNFCEGTT